MGVERRIQRKEDLALARREARQLQREHEGIFHNVPVPVSELAYVLGLAIEHRTELEQRARLEVFETDGIQEATIAVRDGLDRNVSRFAVAHEIGHAILLRKHPQAAREWDVSRREVFANSFAAEILATPEMRANMATPFRSLQNPMGLLRLASDIGFSPRALLTMAEREPSWIEGLNKIWLRVKHVENAFTHADARLRIVSAHYDKRLFYVATNQSLVRFVGSDRWVTSLPVGALAQYETPVPIKFRQRTQEIPKFLTKQIPARLSAVRLHPSAAEPGAYLIILVDLAISPNNNTC